MANKTNTKPEEVKEVSMEELEETTEVAVEEDTAVEEKVGVITKIKEAAEEHPKIAKAAKTAGIAVLGVVAGVLGYKKLFAKTYIDAEFTDAPNEGFEVVEPAESESSESEAV